MKPSARSRSYKWWVVGMLWSVCFFNYADRQAIFSVFPLLTADLHLSDVQLGIIGSSFMWAYAFFGPVAGWTCDVVSRRTLVIGGLVAWSGATLATAHAHDFHELVLWRVISGLAEAFYFPASISLISDFHGVDTRSRAMSLHQSSVYAGSAVGGALCGILAQAFGRWQVSFVVFGALGIALAVLLTQTLVEPPRGLSDAYVAPAVSRSSLITRLKPLLSSPRVLLLVAAFIGANFVAVIFLSWMPAFLYRRFHLGLAMSGIDGTLYLSAACCVGTLLGGWLADRLSSGSRRGAKRIRSGRMLTQSLGLLAGAPFLLLAGLGRSLAVVLVAVTCFGVCKGIYDSNIWASLYDLIEVEQRGTAVGFMNSLGWLGGGVAPVAVAVGAAHFGIGPCISATAVIYAGFGIALLAAASARSDRQPSYAAATPPYSSDRRLR